MQFGNPLTAVSITQGQVWAVAPQAVALTSGVGLTIPSIALPPGVNAIGLHLLPPAGGGWQGVEWTVIGVNTGSVYYSGQPGADWRATPLLPPNLVAMKPVPGDLEGSLQLSLLAPLANATLKVAVSAWVGPLPPFTPTVEPGLIVSGSAIGSLNLLPPDPLGRWYEILGGTYLGPGNLYVNGTLSEVVAASSYEPGPGVDTSPNFALSEPVICSRVDMNNPSGTTASTASVTYRYHRGG